MIQSKSFGHFSQRCRSITTTQLGGHIGHIVPNPTYVHLVQEVIDGLNGKLEGKLDYPLAAMVMPATIEHIRAVSLHQERMPAKSTYFYPKLVSGLVVHPLA